MIFKKIRSDLIAVSLACLAFTGCKTVNEIEFVGPVDEYVMKKVAPSCGNTNFVPVLIYKVFDTKEAFFVGSGTVMVKSNTDFCMSCAHVVSTAEKPGRYGFRILRPFEDKVNFGIDEILIDEDHWGTKTRDAVLMAYGRKAKPIAHVWKKATVTDGNDIVLQYLNKPFKVTSVVTGERLDVVAQVDLPDQDTAFVIASRSYQGESGSGYFTDDGKLFILSDATGKPQSMKCDKSVRGKYLTFLSGPFAFE